MIRFGIPPKFIITLLLQSLKNQKVKFEFTAITSFDVMEDLSGIEGRWYVSDSYLPDDFADRFHAKYGHALRYGVGNYYEAVRLHIHAFEKVGGDFPKKAIKVLLAIKDFPSIFGPTSVNTKGIFSYPAKYMRIKDGKRLLINAADITK